MKRPFFFRLLSFSALTALFVGSLAANTAIEPVPRDEKWVGRHDGFVQIAKAGGVDVLFVGDSITDGWRTKGKLLWDGHFAPLKAANFGIGGDRTQHVLWRLRNGELDGISPKVVVLMIGTNNTGFEKDKSPRNTEKETIEGVTAVVKELRTRLPSAKILLLAVFPRGEKDSLARKQVNAVNEGIAKLHDGGAVTYLDIGQRFLYPDGTLPKEIMPDLLHPNEVGYAIWADAIKAPLEKLLKG
ncbi:MAG TPA: platelet-activating factor acetylhydrolase IB subunit [Opitutaceae bacterium]|nr:platelet-activating factor acetylhydrolase IB subunit [Opitutaceae bacterium]